jgi:hypothetical protein
MAKVRKLGFIDEFLATTLFSDKKSIFAAGKSYTTSSY